MELQFINYICGVILKYAALFLLITSGCFSVYKKLFRKTKAKLPIRAYFHKSLMLNSTGLKETFLFDCLFQFQRTLILLLIVSCTTTLIIIGFTRL